MPGGPTLIGLGAFAAIKLTGYSVAGSALNRWNDVSAPHPLAFGGARTLLGLGAGVAYGSLALRAGVDHSELLFYLGLLPVRLAEWSAMLWLFYRASSRPRSVDALRGSLWSYCLDIPAILAAFTVPGGFWIC